MSAGHSRSSRPRASSRRTSKSRLGQYVEYAVPEMSDYLDHYYDDYQDFYPSTSNQQSSNSMTNEFVPASFSNHDLQPTGTGFNYQMPTISSETRESACRRSSRQTAASADTDSSCLANQIYNETHLRNKPSYSSSTRRARIDRLLQPGSKLSGILKKRSRQNPTIPEQPERYVPNDMSIAILNEIRLGRLKLDLGVWMIALSQEQSSSMPIPPSRARVEELRKWISTSASNLPPSVRSELELLLVEKVEKKRTRDSDMTGVDRRPRNRTDGKASTRSDVLSNNRRVPGKAKAAGSKRPAPKNSVGNSGKSSVLQQNKSFMIVSDREFYSSAAGLESKRAKLDALTDKVARIRAAAKSKSSVAAESSSLRRAGSENRIGGFKRYDSDLSTGSVNDGGMIRSPGRAKSLSRLPSNHTGFSLTDSRPASKSCLHSLTAESRCSKTSVSSSGCSTKLSRNASFVKAGGRLTPENLQREPSMSQQQTQLSRSYSKLSNSSHSSKQKRDIPSKDRIGLSGTKSGRKSLPSNRRKTSTREMSASPASSTRRPRGCQCKGCQMRHDRENKNCPSANTSFTSASSSSSKTSSSRKNSPKTPSRPQFLVRSPGSRNRTSMDARKDAVRRSDSKMRNGHESLQDKNVRRSKNRPSHGRRNSPKCYCQDCDDDVTGSSSARHRSTSVSREMNGKRSRHVSESCSGCELNSHRSASSHRENSGLRNPPSGKLAPKGKKVLSGKAAALIPSRSRDRSLSDLGNRCTSASCRCRSCTKIGKTGGTGKSQEPSLLRSYTAGDARTFRAGASRQSSTTSTSIITGGRQISKKDLDGICGARPALQKSISGKINACTCKGGLRGQCSRTSKVDCDSFNSGNVSRSSGPSGVARGGGTKVLDSSGSIVSMKSLENGRNRNGGSKMQEALLISRNSDLSSYDVMTQDGSPRCCCFCGNSDSYTPRTSLRRWKSSLSGQSQSAIPREFLNSSSAYISVTEKQRISEAGRYHVSSAGILPSESFVSSRSVRSPSAKSSARAPLGPKWDSSHKAGIPNEPQPLPALKQWRDPHKTNSGSKISSRWTDIGRHQKFKVLTVSHGVEWKRLQPLPPGLENTSETDCRGQSANRPVTRDTLPWFVQKSSAVQRSRWLCSSSVGTQTDDLNGSGFPGSVAEIPHCGSFIVKGAIPVKSTSSKKSLCSNSSRRSGINRFVAENLNGQTAPRSFYAQPELLLSSSEVEANLADGNTDLNMSASDTHVSVSQNFAAAHSEKIHDFADNPKTGQNCTYRFVDRPTNWTLVSYLDQISSPCPHTADKLSFSVDISSADNSIGKVEDIRLERMPSDVDSINLSDLTLDGRQTAADNGVPTGASPDSRIKALSHLAAVRISFSLRPKRKRPNDDTGNSAEAPVPPATASWSEISERTVDELCEPESLSRGRVVTSVSDVFGTNAALPQCHDPANFPALENPISDLPPPSSYNRISAVAPCNVAGKFDLCICPAVSISSERTLDLPGSFAVSQNSMRHAVSVTEIADGVSRSAQPPIDSNGCIPDTVNSHIGNSAEECPNSRAADGNVSRRELPTLCLSNSQQIIAYLSENRLILECRESDDRADGCDKTAFDSRTLSAEESSKSGSDIPTRSDENACSTPIAVQSSDAEGDTPAESENGTNSTLEEPELLTPVADDLQSRSDKESSTLILHGDDIQHRSESVEATVVDVDSVFSISLSVGSVSSTVVRRHAKPADPRHTSSLPFFPTGTSPGPSTSFCKLFCAALSCKVPNRSFPSLKCSVSEFPFVSGLGIDQDYTLNSQTFSLSSSGNSFRNSEAGNSQSMSSSIVLGTDVSMERNSKDAVSNRSRDRTFQNSDRRQLSQRNIVTQIFSSSSFASSGIPLASGSGFSTYVDENFDNCCSSVCPDVDTKPRNSPVTKPLTVSRNPEDDGCSAVTSVWDSDSGDEDDFGIFSAGEAFSHLNDYREKCSRNIATATNPVDSIPFVGDCIQCVPVCGNQRKDVVDTLHGWTPAEGSQVKNKIVDGLDKSELGEMLTGKGLVWERSGACGGIGDELAPHDINPFVGMVWENTRLLKESRREDNPSPNCGIRSYGIPEDDADDAMPEEFHVNLSTQNVTDDNCCVLNVLDLERQTSFSIFLSAANDGDHGNVCSEDCPENEAALSSVSDGDIRAENPNQDCDTDLISLTEHFDPGKGECFESSMVEASEHINGKRRQDLHDHEVKISEKQQHILKKTDKESCSMSDVKGAQSDTDEVCVMTSSDIDRQASSLTPSGSFAAGKTSGVRLTEGNVSAENGERSLAVDERSLPVATHEESDSDLDEICVLNPSDIDHKASSSVHFQCARITGKTRRNSPPTAIERFTKSDRCNCGQDFHGDDDVEGTRISRSHDLRLEDARHVKVSGDERHKFDPCPEIAAAIREIQQATGGMPVRDAVAKPPKVPHSRPPDESKTDDSKVQTAWRNDGATNSPEYISGNLASTAAVLPTFETADTAPGVVASNEVLEDHDVKIRQLKEQNEQLERQLRDLQVGSVPDRIYSCQQPKEEDADDLVFQSLPAYRSFMRSAHLAAESSQFGANYDELLIRLRAEEGFGGKGAEEKLIWMLWHEKEQATARVREWEAAVRDMGLCPGNVRHALQTLKEEKSSLCDERDDCRSRATDVERCKDAVQNKLLRHIETLIDDKCCKPMTNQSLWVPPPGTINPAPKSGFNPAAENLRFPKSGMVTESFSDPFVSLRSIPCGAAETPAADPEFSGPDSVPSLLLRASTTQAAGITLAQQVESVRSRSSAGNPPPGFPKLESKMADPSISSSNTGVMNPTNSKSGQVSSTTLSRPAAVATNSSIFPPDHLDGSNHGKANSEMSLEHPTVSPRCADPTIATTPGISGYGSAVLGNPTSPGFPAVVPETSCNLDIIGQQLLDCQKVVSELLIKKDATDHNISTDQREGRPSTNTAALLTPTGDAETDVAKTSCNDAVNFQAPPKWQQQMVVHQYSRPAYIAPGIPTAPEIAQVAETGIPGGNLTSQPQSHVLSVPASARHGCSRGEVTLLRPSGPPEINVLKTQLQRLLNSCTTSAPTPCVVPATMPPSCVPVGTQSADIPPVHHIPADISTLPSTAADCVSTTTTGRVPAPSGVSSPGHPQPESAAAETVDDIIARCEARAKALLGSTLLSCGSDD